MAGNGVPQPPNLEPETVIQKAPETEAIATPSEKKQKPLLAITLAILLIISLGLAGYFTYQIKKSKNQPTPTQSAPTPTINPTDSWKSYINSEFQFQVKYPSKWYFYEPEAQGEYSKKTIGFWPEYGEGEVEGIWISVTDFRFEYQSLDDWWNEYEKFSNATKTEKNQQFIETRKITVSGQSAIEEKTTQGYSSRPYRNVFILSPSNEIVKIFTNITVASSPYFSYFDQILSTFKFTGQTNPTANWKTYTNSVHGYQISFQSDWEKLAGPPEENDVLNFRKGDYEIGLSTMTTSYSTIQEYLKQSDKDSQTAWEGTPSIKVLSTKLTKVNNYNVVQREEQWLPAGFLKPVINTYFLYKNYIYSITLKYIGNNSNSIQETDIYQRVLSTFKFTN